MSAQGATLRRGTIHLPIVPVAVLVAAAVAVAIGLTVIGGTEGRVVTHVSDLERFANSSAAIRERGGTLPAVRSLDMTRLGNASMWTIGQAEAYIAAMDRFANSSAAVREQGGTLGGTLTTTYVHGLENPTVYGAAWGSVGGPNEALHRQYSPPQETVASGPEPIVVNGAICGQCR